MGSDGPSTDTKSNALATAARLGVLRGKVGFAHATCDPCLGRSVRCKRPSEHPSPSFGWDVESGQLLGTG